ncbi:LysR family transcriptional regulator [Sulfitobacter sp. PS-8MA]|uniref:LysR family transcriptional regulator n=1 Tax=Sulfitobacter sp. PS-8MA TaxID=3237707 RepID=UPI0034C5D097
MDIKWIEDYLVLARARNFSRASDERNVTQPAFSRRIRALETWLGVPLFDRRTYPITLTEQGRAFRETAELVLSSLHTDRAEFLQQVHHSRPDLRIAAATTLNLNFIPEWLKSLEPQTGHLTTHISTQNFHDMVQQLADGMVDFVMQYAHADAPLLFEQSRFDSRVLAHDLLIMTSPVDAAGAPLFDPSKAGPEHPPLPYMGYSSDGYFADIEALLLNRHLQTGPALERLGQSPTSEVLKRMALSHGALALLPESCARDALDQGQLVRVGGEDWATALEVRLYRLRGSRRAAVRKIWQATTPIEETNTPMGEKA